MSLKKRIEKLELLRTQRDCDHSWCAIGVRSEGNNLTVESACWLCHKTISRTGHGKELEAVEKTLRDFLLKFEEAK